MKIFLKYIVYTLVIFTFILTGSQEALAQAAEEDNLLVEIQERGVLNVGSQAGYAPFIFMINEEGTNEFVGSDMSLAKEIADDLEVELNYIDMDFGNLITSLQTGTIDLMIGGISYTEERDASIDFTIPYHSDVQSFVIRMENEGEITGAGSFVENDLVVGVQEATIQETFIRETMPEDTEIVVMRQSGDLIAALQAGQIDGAIFDDAVAGAFAAENLDLSTVESGLDIENPEKSFGIPEGAVELQTAINQTIERVNDEGAYQGYIDESYEQIASNQETNWLNYWPYFWNGIKTTLLISSVSILVGMVLGSILALMRISGINLLDWIARLYIEVIRGTPLIIQVLFMYIGIGAFFNWNTLTASLVAVSLNSGAYIAEIIRGGILSVAKGQTEASRALGLDYWTTMRRIIFPQSLRSIWPSLGNEFITLIKESSIVSTIGVAELTFQTRAVTSITYRGVEPLVISMILYLVMTWSLSLLLAWYEKKINVEQVR